MSKLYGLFDIRGKRDGYKYYGMKGVNGTIQAKINEGMSSRVKNSPEYANTRLNNAEFGAAGNMAGAIAKALTQRWRSVTVPFATAKMLPGIKLAMGQDATHPWGQRSLTGTDWQDGLRQQINGISKISFDEVFGLNLRQTADEAGKTHFEFEGKIAQAENLASKGLNKVLFEFYEVSIAAPVYSSDINSYTQATVQQIDTQRFDSDINDNFEEGVDFTKSSAALDASHNLGAIIIVAKPFRTINGVDYVAQEYCCHKLVKVSAIA